MARGRAVVVIQPPGLGGRPSPGHLRRATANASCTASSARSMSPKTRIRAATDRPDSARKIRPIADSSRFGAVSPSCTLSGLGVILRLGKAVESGSVRRTGVRERTDLYRRLNGSAHLRGPGERGVEVLGLDDV